MPCVISTRLPLLGKVPLFLNIMISEVRLAPLPGEVVSPTSLFFRLSRTGVDNRAPEHHLGREGCKDQAKCRIIDKVAVLCIATL